VQLENVTQTVNKKGETKEQVERLTRELKLPASMQELIAKFENFQAAGPAVPVAEDVIERG
jgi:hypothetical protein